MNTPERWCPERCPITGRPFFMWIEHHASAQMVPTYGGPLDSYTIPVRADDGSYECERYDHDAGGWLVDQVEDVGLRVVSDDAINEILSTHDAFADTLGNWSKAYPLSAFPEPDLERARAVLEAAGMTLDSLSASSMRHVTTKLFAEFQPLRGAIEAAFPDQ